MARAADMADGWVILTTTAARTLPLAASLAAAGVECWAPHRVERKVGRGKQRKAVTQIQMPIVPGFVFARAPALTDLLRDRAAPTSPHPRYRVLRDGGRIPLVADRSLTALRAAEERFRVSHLKTVRRKWEPGASVRIKEGVAQGMVGVVVHGSDREARIDFGNGFRMTIASYLIGTDVVQGAVQPSLGADA